MYVFINNIDMQLDIISTLDFKGKFNFVYLRILSFTFIVIISTVISLEKFNFLSMLNKH